MRATRGNFRQIRRGQPIGRVDGELAAWLRSTLSMFAWIADMGAPNRVNRRDNNEFQPLKISFRSRVSCVVR